ncbi:Ribokinase [Lachnellula subtilissima]|uniref:Ribokinase n=1 Tax=Lachnellula subtilissima TaxID=602034 RepID=A0A8H8RCE5_9HELO|nr:Ribokinase [Lachnellula subtilissima]
MAPKTISITGGLDYDLIVIANRIPDGGESLLANECLEALGGKGANSAISTYRTCHKRPIGFDSQDKNEDVLEESGKPKPVVWQCLQPLITKTTFKPLRRTAGDRRRRRRADDRYGWPSRIDFLLNAAPASPVTKRTYRYITHLLVNESEAAAMSNRVRDEVRQETWPIIAQEFLNWGVKNVVITLGAKGAYYANASCRAGDTFTGAYASNYLRQKTAGDWNIRAAVVRANKAAAITIEKLGAQAGIPWADEIDRFDAPFNDPAV